VQFVFFSVPCDCLALSIYWHIVSRAQVSVREVLAEADFVIGVRLKKYSIFVKTVGMLRRTF
jgi:hypothetical protein